MNVSPQSQAIDARAVVNGDVTQFIAHTNHMLASQYIEAVSQWVFNKQQQPAGTLLPPIPVPPASWVEVPHAYTLQEKQYDAAWPGIAPLIDCAQTGPPVRPQYVEPATPAGPPKGTVVGIGPYLRDGEYAALPTDNMPDGFMTSGPGGSILRKVTRATPFGVAQWYQVIA